MIKLKPCPFCRSKNVEVRGNQWYWVECRDCFTSISPCSTEKEAIEEWNRWAIDERENEKT